MRMETEHMSFKIHWMISSSYDFQAHQQCAQRRWWFSHTAQKWFDVLQGMSSALPGAPLVITKPPMSTSISCWCSQVHLKATAPVPYTLGFDHAGILVWQLSDTCRGSRRQKFILLMLYRWSRLNFSAWIVTVALYIIAVGDCQLLLGVLP